ncbi:MAG TPA: glucose/sorbosone family PQQ-dependent dehydrogenase [Bryobacteraceae bacterium]|nr:glucose/sorbosone family PQQ-dependent dehydrogenase [Bryobacteraceae bacterium]
MQRGTKQFRRTVVASGLANPWEITWGPDGKLWLTERSGKRITRIDPTSGDRKVAATIDEVSAPGGQDGLLGMALHPDLLKRRNTDHVYVAYTYQDKGRGADPNITAADSPYRFLYMKIVRFTYDAAAETLSDPTTVIEGLPAGNDHLAGRLKIGPDRKLYLTIGDQGHNQLGNSCLAVESQRLPTQKEIATKDFVAYQGKSLRINMDGSIPNDNPKINGVISHVFTYGHRNPQGLDFAPDGTIYSSEQGPKTDDEVNILKPGGNYGWPHVAGLKDNKAYEFARWAEATTPCSQIRFSDLAIHPSVPREPESAFTKPMIDPLATMFTVPNDYNFSDPACRGVNFICWPTVAASSIEHYQSKGIPGWDRVLFVTTLKRGSLYVVPLKPNGQASAGHMSRYFQSENRFRDTAVSPDGKTIYVATDAGGISQSMAGGVARRMQDSGAILAFTYTGEGTGKETEEPKLISQAAKPQPDEPRASSAAIANATPPQFTAAQAAVGKTAYNANCAVCHGSSMTNGTMGTPLAGEYFRTTWFNRTVKALYDKSHKTMPPAAPASLPAETYANIVAYILELNGFKPGATALPAGGDALEKMAIK